MHRLPLVIVAILLPVPAMAYIGPGAGISAIGSLLALLGAIVLAVFGLVWYPVKRLIRRRKAAPAELSKDSGSGE